MRAWDAFTGLDSLVKNMVTSLRAVGELQNPAIRDRHWEQLMQATQVSNVLNIIAVYIVLPVSEWMLTMDAGVVELGVVLAGHVLHIWCMIIHVCR